MRKYYEPNIKKLYVLEEVINILDLELCCLEGIKMRDIVLHKNIKG